MKSLSLLINLLIVVANARPERFAILAELNEDAIYGTMKALMPIVYQLAFEGKTVSVNNTFTYQGKNLKINEIEFLNLGAFKDIDFKYN